MEKAVICIVIFIATTCFVCGNAHMQVSYSEIESLNATCLKDRCEDPNSLNTVDSLSSRQCECGPFCAKYDTCCIDSPNRAHVLKERSGKVLPVCIQIPTDYAWTEWFWMVDKCDSKWNGSSSMRDMCQRTVLNIRDPFAVIPAYHEETNTTYKNFFCGICNGIEPGRLKLWDIKIKQNRYDSPEPEDKDDFMNQLVFNESYNAWGTWEIENDNMVFKTVSVFLVKRENARVCMPYLISDCSRMWEDDMVRRKCHSYMAPVYVRRSPESRSDRYRNIHCAICNFEVIANNVECNPPPSKFGSPALSFTLLLDFNSKDGKNVGEVSRCGSGESYDPFFKKCRALACGLPGYVIKDGRCTKS